MDAVAESKKSSKETIANKWLPALGKGMAWISIYELL